ncbi:hypothetical protein WCLP8_5350007 [uncultured Gammaproteobacteria bacterium]
MSSIMFASKTMASMLVGLVIMYNFMVVGVQNVFGIYLPNPIDIFALPWISGLY